jgi:carbon storage regulator
MLVISRRTKEQVVIDGHIMIQVLANRHGRVRLGITAPKHVRIERSEVAARRVEECSSTPQEDRHSCPSG